jgi:dTDP-4-dehydrorhamnose reductase
MERVLITGASGLLGSNLVLELSRRFEIAATYYQHPLHLDDCEMIPMNITQANEAWAIIRRVEPHVVIHCAAETRVDYCEEYPDEAFRTNVAGTQNLAKATAHIGAKFVYISTDSVFDGQIGMYNEEASPNPPNVYARTKLAGEQVVKQHVVNHLIVRTNIYGWNARPKFSLAEWILDRLDHGQIVPGFADVYFSPILVNDLAEILVHMINADLQGVYHAGASEHCSKLDFAGVLCKMFDRDVSLVRPANSGEAGFKAPRPKDTSLDVSKITQVLGRAMPGIVDGLSRFRRLLEDGYVSRLRSGFTQEEVAP